MVCPITQGDHKQQLVVFYINFAQCHRPLTFTCNGSENDKDRKVPKQCP